MENNLKHSEVAEKLIAEAILKARKQYAWFGTWILFRREIKRFLSIIGQSIISPVLSTLLYFLVFGFSLGQRIDTVLGIPYIDFIAPGLVTMTLINNSFFNSSFSFFLGKIHGSIVDLLASPIGPLQMLLAYSSAAILRGMMTGIIIWIISQFMGASTLHSPLIALAFMLGSSFVFGLFGLVTAILATEFEHINFIPSFVTMPLSFLGGVFYSTSMLSEFWSNISRLNPILYIVNGIRYGMTGVADVPVWQGALFLSTTGIALLFYAYYLLQSGKKVRE